MNRCWVGVRNDWSVTQIPTSGNSQQCRGQPAGFSKAVDCSSMGIEHSHKTSLPRTLQMCPLQQPQWEGSSLPSHVQDLLCIGERQRSHWRIKPHVQCSCVFYLFQSSPHPREEKKKAKKYHEGRCISSQFQHFFSMWLNIPIKSMIKSLDPLGFERRQTSSSAELHVPFWNSGTKDKTPPVQESFF